MHTKVELMDRIIEMFQPNMNLNAQLPKNFKKENPKAKRSDYPQKTGYTALHFGMHLYWKHRLAHTHFFFN